MGPHFIRASQLFNLRKFDLAEQELRLDLLEAPESPMAHALLALCLAKRGAFDEAVAEARAAIHQEPDAPLGHYALASVLEDRRLYDEAAGSVLEAMRLDPGDPDSPALLAQIRYHQRLWPAALEAAERGLELDPEHAGCSNLRAMALIKLGRQAEAGSTLEAALARDPEDPYTHANQGWALLQQGDPKRAMVHFREALRLDPTLEHARVGVIEALKARNVVYRLLLRYFFWMSRLSRKAQWGVILGAYFGQHVIRKVSESSPALAPILEPILALYLVFALLTWLAQPLFNLLLRLNRTGRLALSRDQTTASNFVGAIFLLALACLAMWPITKNSDFGAAAIVLGLLMIPLSAAFSLHAGWPRRLMLLYATVLAFVAVAFFTLPYLELAGVGEKGIERGLVTVMWVFVIGVVLSQWVALGLAHVRPRR